MSRGPLTGVRIADFSWVGAGSFTTKLLADHGADVIKVESSRKVDSLRLAAPFAGEVAGLNRSGYFADRNSSKRSITINLKTIAGQRVARQLIAESDVVVNNFTPGVMDRFGLGWNDVREFKPDSVYLAMSVQGSTGPASAELGYGMTIGAAVGLQYLTGLPDRVPVGTGTNYPDHIPNPCHAAFAVLAALRHLRRTGEGQFIDLAQTEPAIAVLATAILAAEVNNEEQGRRGNHHRDHAPHNVYRCGGEDTWIALSASTDEQWVHIAACLGIDHREVWTTERGRKSDELELDRVIASSVRSWDVAELEAILRAGGVPAGRVSTAKDLLDDPQLAHRQHWVRLNHPEMGETVYNAPAFRLSATPGELTRPAPCLGEHTDEICRTVLGMSTADIERLKIDGALS